ncbi:CAAX prenyl protease-like protein [Curtobacterium sp. AG1037]|uniref:CPBP family intramembrane glutamic endopeptidase n=1 Tax=Curtobacterium sp. AG1037 TaxID=2183990 RepID=UPI000E0B07BC|nr:CPBP family intramembrane glutamic endopeptidase [Curtobacterium sp. AG1037]RDH95064.1 CAAX prenyl protease-like protein [Curtobacterium sp. AG1037]
MRAVAWGSIGFVVIVGWGWPTVAAIAVLAGAPLPRQSHGSTDADLLHELFKLNGVAWTAGVAVLAAILMRAFAGRPPRAIAWARGALTVPIGLTVMAFAFVALAGVSVVFHLEQNNYPWPGIEGAPAMILATIDAGLPGPSEELALTGLVVVALRRADVGWGWVYLVAVAVRIPFHLYYGWGVLAFAFWPVAFVYLYRRTGAIWGLVAAHTVYDLAAFLSAYEVVPDAPQLRNVFAAAAIVVIVLVPGVRSIVRDRTKRRQRAENVL